MARQAPQPRPGSRTGGGYVKLRRQALQAQIRNQSAAAAAASAPVLITPPSGSLVLTGFAPSVATPTTVTPASAALILSGFAPTVATPRLVSPGTATLTLAGRVPTVSTPRLVTPATATLTLTGFAPTVATPRVATPGTLALTLSTFAPVVATTANVLVTPPVATISLTGFAPVAQGDYPVSTDASGGGQVIRILRESEINTRPLPFKVPHHELPEAPRPLEVQYVTVKPDDTDAYVALLASGEITLDEFVALLAA